jgi:hypothetical protein
VQSASAPTNAADDEALSLSCVAILAARGADAIQRQAEYEYLVLPVIRQGWEIASFGLVSRAAKAHVFRVGLHDQARRGPPG